MSAYRTIVPPIKCQGIKTKLVPWIRAVVPSDFDGRWIEPFMGSGVVAFNIRPKRAVLADSNPHIVNFYTAIVEKKITSTSIRRFLEKEGSALLRYGGQHYYTIRDRFNRYHDPMDFLFLNRACFNGLIRFNHDGNFNVPFCRKPGRFSQAYITKISNQVQAVSDILSLGDYEFICQDFSDTIGAAKYEDLIYCDPPYIARHSDYFNGWDEECEREMAALLSAASCRFVLSTWHSNDFRENRFIGSLWSDFQLLTRKHFYHVGAKEDNRNPMIEALLMNFDATLYEVPEEPVEQLVLLETGVKYDDAPSPGPSPVE